MYARKLCFIPNLYPNGLLSVASLFHLPCKNMSSLFHHRSTRRRFLYANLTENVKIEYIEMKSFALLNLWRTIYRRYSETSSVTFLSGGKSKLFPEKELDEKDKLLSKVVRQLNEDHGVNICVVETSEERKKYADYVVVVSGASTRHLKAMTNHLYEQSKRDISGRISTVNGLDSDDWMIVDIGSIVVHLFLPEVRAKYELEKLWSLGPEKDEQYQAMLDDDRFLEIIKNAKLDDFFIKDDNEDEPSINIVVHLFLPEVRAKYELEKLWSLGPEKDEQYQAMLDDDRFLEIIKNAKLDDFFIKEDNEDEPSIK